MRVSREYMRELNLIVDDIFEASGDMTLVDMAKKAGLSYQTVLNLNSHKTKLPQPV